MIVYFFETNFSFPEMKPSKSAVKIRFSEIKETKIKTIWFDAHGFVLCSFFNFFNIFLKYMYVFSFPIYAFFAFLDSSSFPHFFVYLYDVSHASLVNNILLMCIL